MTPAAASGWLAPFPFFVLVGVLGLIAGSFVTALSHRLPRGESIAAGRSKCPACGITLGILDLIPVLSWIFSRGRCRACGAAVSWRYPAIELCTMLMFLSAGALAASLTDLGLLMFMAGVLVTLCVIDLEHRRLPNVLTAVLAAAMAAWRWEHGVPLDVATGLAVAAAILVAGLAIGAVSRPAGLGPGDAKILAAAALGLPWWQFVVFAGLTGSVAIFFILLWQTRGRGPNAPFGPSVAAGLWLCLLFPDIYKSFAP